MSKAFTRENDTAPDDEDDSPGLPPLPAGARNYMTPQGYQRLRAELMQLLDDERPKVVETVSWAAKNGDRSENGDYLYGKKRLREIDRRIRFLTKRRRLGLGSYRLFPLEHRRKKTICTMQVGTQPHIRTL